VSNNPNSSAKSATSIPQDNPKRALTVSRADDHSAQHIGLVGDTYTILLTGKDTAGRFCLIDMHVPPSGGPLLTATTSKNLSSFLKVKSRLLFAAQSPL
jgi:hypothetical protein